MCVETTLGEFAISLVFVISCIPVDVETESRKFSTLKVQRVYPCSNILAYAYIYIGTSPFGLMGDQTVHEDSNNMTVLNRSISFHKKFG